MKLLYLFFVNLLGHGTPEHLEDVNDAEPTSSEEMIDDMILSPSQVEFLYSPLETGRNAKIALSSRWMDGIIPYEVTSEFDANEKALIAKILQEEFAKTCIQFRLRTETDIDYIQVVNGKGCRSHIGRSGNLQEINLQKNKCLTRRHIAHEFLHAVGLYHQHSASNRDDYIDVIWKNIKPAHVKNFKKYKPNRVSDFGEPYDYNSIMHYSAGAFSLNEKPTLVAKNSNVRFGGVSSLSASDIAKVNKMYNCKV